MRLIIKSVVFLSSLLFIIPISQAGIHVEPYGSIGGSYSGAAASKPAFFITYDLGGRLGYSFSGFGLGIDLFWTHHGLGGAKTQPTVIVSPDKVRGPDD